MSQHQFYLTKCMIFFSAIAGYGFIKEGKTESICIGVFFLFLSIMRVIIPEELKREETNG